MQLNESPRSLSILLVEDNRADARLMVEALAETQSRVMVSVAADGETALSFLRHEGPFAEAGRPDIVLLDLNLPGMDGREVLAEIMMDADLRGIPVLVLTSSQNQQDIRRCYDLGANCYITKPVTLDRFLEVVEAVKRFWLSVATLPEDQAYGTQDPLDPDH